MDDSMTISFNQTAFFANSSINEVSFIRRCTPLRSTKVELRGASQSVACPPKLKRAQAGSHRLPDHAHQAIHINSAKRRYMLEHPSMEHYLTRNLVNVKMCLLRTISREFYSL